MKKVKPLGDKLLIQRIVDEFTPMLLEGSTGLYVPKTYH